MRRPGPRAFGVSGPRVAVRLTGLRMHPVLRMRPVLRVRPVQCGGPGHSRLVAVGRLMLRTGLNGRARPDSDDEGRDDGVRIHSDAYASSAGDAVPLSRTVSSHGKI